MKPSRIERGWAGHFCSSHNCRFHRNTLVSCDGKHIVVSTVGAYWVLGELTEIGSDRYYETMIFVGTLQDVYIEADNEKIDSPIPWKITAGSANHLPLGVDNLADAMHEANVDYIQRHFNDLYPS